MNAPGPEQELFALTLHDDDDVFVARHAGREVASTLGVSGQERVRVTTALSEVGRDVVAGGGGRLAFLLHGAEALHVVVHVDGVVDVLPGGAWSDGLQAARRLVDDVTVTASADGHAVLRLEKRLDAPARLDESDRADLSRRLAARVGHTSQDELRVQNRELLVSLEAEQARRDELETANAELTETNRGVLALYDELSGELETTNQGVVALYAEIDDKSRQLREASESKTRFLNNISHELRTPGNSVLGLARLLLDPGADPLSAEQRQQVELVSSSAEDLLRLVNELLDLAKAESGRIEATAEPVDLAGLFDELRGTIAPLVTRDEVSLVVESPDVDAPIVSDRTLLRHLLRNLLSNAVKFTEHGSVTLRATTSGGRLRLEVRDTGVGIAVEDQPRVFEEFYQVRGPLQRAQGSGLGLPFARRVAVILGGDLVLDSVPGEGSTFAVELPLSGPPPGDQTRDRADAGTSTGREHR